MGAQNGPSLIGSGLYRSSQNVIVIAPGQMITLRLTHLQTLLDTSSGSFRLANTSELPLPTTFHGISVNLWQDLNSSSATYALPISGLLQVESCTPNAIPAQPPQNGNVPDCYFSYLTVQIPYNIAVRHGAGRPVPSFITVIENGTVSEYFPVTPIDNAIYLLMTCDSPAIAPPGGLCAPLVNHEDGTPVTDQSPAVAGEILTLHGWGLGVPLVLDPQLAAGSPPPSLSPTLDASRFRILFRFGKNKLDPPDVSQMKGHHPESVSMTADAVGEYDIRVRLPKSFPSSVEACTSVVDPNLVIDVIAGSYGSIGICAVP